MAAPVANASLRALIAFETERALGLLDEGTPLVHSVRGDLLARLERHGEARDEFERAAALAANRRERDLSARRAAESASRAEGGLG